MKTNFVLIMCDQQLREHLGCYGSRYGVTPNLIRRPDDVSELYDLVRDPNEIVNHYGQPGYAKIQAELESRLLDWYIQTSDVTPFERQNRDYPEGLLVP